MDHQRNHNIISRMRFLVFAVIILAGLIAGCDSVFDTKPPNPNNPPNTTLANIPVQGDTLFALVTLHWDGEDNDGFVEKYEYRYITRDVETGESISTDWKETDQTSLTIPFNSPNMLNKQEFQVRSVDNNGDADESPAERVFYTRQTKAPKVEIVEPVNKSQKFYQDHVTDWYQGVRLTYQGSDDDGSIEEYGWAVDNGDWNWTQDTTLYINPMEFSGAGKHLIRLTARDNTNLVSTNPDTVEVELIKPSFSKDILIIDETKESAFPSSVKATDEEVDQFYADIFGTNESWDYNKKGMPSKELMGQYKMIIWHADNNFSSSSTAHELGQHGQDIAEYMNVGGDFIMSGWRILKSFAPSEDFPQNFKEGTFVSDYLHIKSADESPITVPGDFIGAHGVGDQFSDVDVDSTKLATFPYLGNLVQINTIPSRAGFTDIIYTYRAPTKSQNPEFRGQTVGLRYYGTSFDAVVLGFPIYFLKKDDAAKLANDVLKSLGYR